MNAAIEAAARAKLRWNFPGLSDADIDEMLPDHVEETTAAIIAFLRSCEVSEGMMDASYDVLELAYMAPDIRGEFKAMAAQLATELEGK